MNKYIVRRIVAVVILISIIVTIIISICSIKGDKKEKNKVNEIDSNEISNEELSNKDNENNHKKVDINDWRLTLVNYDNALPENYEVELSDIDKTRKFDSRAIGKLNQMIQAMKDDSILNIWVQSSYRSTEKQQKVFNEQVEEFMKQGKNKEEAEELTLKTINKPGTSEHNLGLAVDLNYVNYDFENSKAFAWLNENAEDYGFILRYKKEKEHITKVDYEPWHWRYVGEEHAKKMNELDMCLEEYVEYLSNK